MSSYNGRTYYDNLGGFAVRIPIGWQFTPGWGGTTVLVLPEGGTRIDVVPLSATGIDEAITWTTIGCLQPLERRDLLVNNASARMLLRPGDAVTGDILSYYVQLTSTRVVLVRITGNFTAALPVVQSLTRRTG